MSLRGSPITQKQKGDRVCINSHSPSAVGCFRASRNNKGAILPLFDFTSPINNHEKSIISDAFSLATPEDNHCLRHKGGCVQQKDFLRLCEGQWVNDVVIDLFMWIFNEREKMKSSKNARCHFFLCSLFQGLACV